MCQLHAPAALPPGKKSSVLTVRAAGWAPERSGCCGAETDLVKGNLAGQPLARHCPGPLQATGMVAGLMVAVRQEQCLAGTGRQLSLRRGWKSITVFTKAHRVAQCNTFLVKWSGRVKPLKLEKP
jgi:hypothetical protein